MTLLHEGDLSQPGVIAAVAEDDTVLWSEQTMGMYYLAPAPIVQDINGNVFIDYNPGRYNGVVTLVPTGQGFDALGTVPTDVHTARFYFAVVVGGSEESGVIWKYENDCEPSCAQGVLTKERFEWDGADYASSSAPQIVVWPDATYIDAVGDN